jgi:phage tail-like protein
LEQILDDLPRYFTPGQHEANGAPDDFLPWLSQWMALSLRTDITHDPVRDNALRRAFIARMAKLYRYRGTKKSMKELLEIFTSRDVTIDDQKDGKPHYFEVHLNLETLKTSDSREAFERAKELAHSVIRLEKPAHTYYLLIPAVTTIRIGQRKEPPPPPRNVALPTKYFIRVGKNSRLGATPKNN